MSDRAGFPALHHDILNRKANGKTIWQPRIECWYSDREYRKEALPGKFAGASVLELFNKLNVSKRLYEFCGCLKAEYTGDIVTSEKKLDDFTRELKIATPDGDVNCILRKNSSNYGEMPLKWWVEEEKDFEVFSYIEENTHFSLDLALYDQLEKEWGHLGLPAIFVPRVGIQRLLIDLCGVENTYYLLSDYPDTVEAYLDSLSRSQMRMMDVMADSPFEWINYGDNVHSKVTPPDIFKKYILPEYQKRNHRLHQAGKFTYAHFDGDVKEILPYFQDCDFDGLEAITPLPQGDVTLKEAKDAMGDLFLIDGISAILFDEVYPLEQLKQQVEECLHLFEGQLVLGISDEMSSTGTLDRIEVVREMVEDFNAKH